MNTTQLLLASVVLVLLGVIVSVPGLLAYRSLLMRTPINPEDMIKRLQQEVDELRATVNAQEKALEATQAEVRALTWKNAELSNALVRLSAQVVALGGKPVVEVEKLVH